MRWLSNYDGRARKSVGLFIEQKYLNSKVKTIIEGTIIRNISLQMFVSVT